MADNSAIINKIRALRALAADAGATDAEALSAATLVSKLMATHSITEQQLKEFAANRTVNTADFNSSERTTYRKLMPWTIVLYQAISRYTDTNPIKFVTTSVVNQRKRTETTIVFFGYSVDVELAAFLFEVCNAAIENDSRTFGRTVVSGARNAAVNTFKLAAATRLSERMRLLKQHAAISTGTDLIVLKDQLVIAAQNAAFGDNSTTTALSVNYSDRKYNAAAVKAAIESADNVRLHRMMSNNEYKAVTK